MPTWIYGLACPESGVVRYVGKSSAPRARFAAHGTERASRAVRAWFADLADCGSSPRLVLFERVADTEDALAAEREWIARFARFGDLLNISPGPAVVLDFPHDTARAGRPALDDLSASAFRTHLEKALTERFGGSGKAFV